VYKQFYVQRKVVQAILSNIASKPNLNFEGFKLSFSRMYDSIFPGVYTFGNLEKSVRRANSLFSNIISTSVLVQRT
jgi:hypothetical protein